MINREKILSIIIPVYNSENYINECLESILKQNTSQCEIILINDGSTDKSPEICNKYNKKYDNIFVIHQKNKGPSVARNTGLESSNGKYVMFVDSDDKITENAINDIRTFIHKDKSDLFIFGYECKNYTNNKIKKEIINHEECNFNIEEFKNKIYKYVDKWYLSLNSNKIFKKEIINRNNIRFDSNIKNSEDLLFNITYIKFCKTISIKNQVLYKYIKKNENSISAIYHNNLVEMQQYAFKKITDILIEINAYDDLNKRVFNKQYASMLFSILYNICNDRYKLNKNEKKKIVEKVINDCKFIEILNNDINDSKVYSIFACIIKLKNYYSINVFMKLVKLYNNAI